MRPPPHISASCPYRPSLLGAVIHKVREASDGDAHPGYGRGRAPGPEADDHGELHLDRRLSGTAASCSATEQQDVARSAAGAFRLRFVASSDARRPGVALLIVIAVAL